MPRTSWSPKMDRSTSGGLAAIFLWNTTFVSCLYLQVTPGWRLSIGCFAIVGGSLLTWLSLSDGPAKKEGDVQLDAA